MVSRQIESLSRNVLDMLHEELLNAQYFSIALAESTDVTGIAQLVIFVRGMASHFTVLEELLVIASLLV